MCQNIFALAPQILSVALEDGIGEKGRGVRIEKGGGESEDVFPQPDGFPCEHEKKEGYSPKGKCYFDGIRDDFVYYEVNRHDQTSGAVSCFLRY